MEFIPVLSKSATEEKEENTYVQELNSLALCSLLRKHRGYFHSAKFGSIVFNLFIPDWYIFELNILKATHCHSWILFLI